MTKVSTDYIHFETTAAAAKGNRGTVIMGCSSTVYRDASIEPWVRLAVRVVDVGHLSDPDEDVWMTEAQAEDLIHKLTLCLCQKRDQLGLPTLPRGNDDEAAI